MEQQKLYIKGMVCERCIESVRLLLHDLSLEIIEISLGEVTIKSGTSLNANLVDERLQKLGFNLLHDRKDQLVREVKELVEKVYSGSFSFEINFSFSRLVAEQLHLAYETISRYRRQNTVPVGKGRFGSKQKIKIQLFCKFR